MDKYAKNYINGALVPARSGGYLDNINPATGNVINQYADSQSEDLDHAVAAAEQAFLEWRKIDAERRFRLLLRIADIIEQNAFTYAQIETIDTGKPLAMANAQEVPNAQALFRYYAAAIYQQTSATQQQDQQLLHYRQRQALGVVSAVLSPYRPLYSLCKTIAPALAMGNTIVIKPSQYTPMIAATLARDLEQAGLPKGVLNIVQGEDEPILNYLADHPNIKAIAYTNSPSIGKRLRQRLSTKNKKLLLTIGGNNPAILLDDCDFDQMMIGILRSSFSNNGQLSHHASRLLIQRELYPKLKEELVKRAQFIKIGNPMATITDLGAILSEKHLSIIEQWLAMVELEGGQILCGGQRVVLEGELTNGYFLRPTVVEGILNTSLLNQEPIFGPIVTLQIFDTDEEAIRLANETSYGLSASIWTKNIQRAHQFVDAIQARTIWVNTWLPENQELRNGGLFGTNLPLDGGQAALDFFSEGKEIGIKYQ
jgi:aminomuconate-semialdehyde/2-hydroxymuconate-6-semialdehyde dehydrogenase